MKGLCSTCVMRPRHKSDRKCCECRAAYNRDYYLSKRSEIREQQAMAYAALRSKCLAMYGGVCRRCAESHQSMLAIDHTEGGGNMHRKAIRSLMVWWLKNNNFPSGYQILCHNCNWLKWVETARTNRKPRHKSAPYVYRYREIGRSEAMRHYGSACACCGLDDKRCLDFDHLDGCGSEHRSREGNEVVHVLWRWLRDRGYPNGFQLLCRNCNMSKHILGRCEHAMVGK